MFKFLIILSVILNSQWVMADANIDKSRPLSTILLQAPGTLSGGAAESLDQQNDGIRQQQPAAASQYRYAEDYYKKQRRNIPQFGQADSGNNPWIENRYGQNMPSPTVPMFYPAPGYNNPWHVGGPRPSEPSSGEPFGMNNSSAAMPQFGLNDPLNNVYPDYTDGIYRDTNPANQYPYYNGMNQGGVGNDFPFSNFNMPFTPFGMF